MKLLLLCLFFSFIFAANATLGVKRLLGKIKRAKDPVSDALLKICEDCFENGTLKDVHEDVKRVLYQKCVDGDESSKIAYFTVHLLESPAPPAYKEVDDTTANSSANTADSARATSNSATTSIGNAWIGAKIYLTPPADFPEIYWKQKCFDTKQNAILLSEAKKSSWIEVENAIREFCTSPDTELHVITIATSVRKDTRTHTLNPVYIKAVWNAELLGNAFICIDSDVVGVKEKFNGWFLSKPSTAELYIKPPQSDNIIQHAFDDYKEFVQRFRTDKEKQ